MGRTVPGLERRTGTWLSSIKLAQWCMFDCANVLSSDLNIVKFARDRRKHGTASKLHLSEIGKEMASKNAKTVIIIIIY